MNRRTATLTLAVVAALAAVALGGACTQKDRSYCDSETQCTDPDFPVCNLELKVCERAPQTDAGADAARDGAADAGGEDGGQTDATPAGDGGCESPQHECGGFCDALDDPAHCGDSCEACTVPTNGTATCDGSSCGFTCNGGYWKNTSTCDPCDTADHCGASCVQCTSAPNHGHPSCDGTSCDFACDSSYWKEGNQCSPCETDSHCGATCVECTAAPSHGQPACGGTSCDFGCDQGYWHNTATCDLCDDDAHCGQSCLPCSGTTPVCDGTPRQCRACQAHEECASGACDADGSCVAADYVIYVDTHAGCPGFGTAASPFCNFPPALSSVSLLRWRIVVRPGSYGFASTQTISSQTVAIIGAGADTTELAYGGAADAAVLSITGASNVSLHGLTIRGATGSNGHGLYCRGNGGTPSITLERCVVTGNGGYGISAESSLVTVTGSTITTNGSIGIASGGLALTVTDSTISGNARGIFVYLNGTATLSRCAVRDNAGTGLSLQGSEYSVKNCLIIGNGWTQPTGTSGGAWLSPSASTMDFVNNTVANNNAASGAPGGVGCPGSATVINSIIWGNSGAQQSGCTVTYSDIQGGGGGAGSLDVDPKFVNAGAGNYHLSTLPASPCIDAGDPSVGVTVDLDGYARSGNPDMGCYEAH